MCRILGHGHHCGKAIGGHKLWGPLNWAKGGGSGTPKARPRPLVGHPTTPSHCMLALMGPLGLGVHWVWPPGAHTTSSWVQWGAQVDPILLRQILTNTLQNVIVPPLDVIVNHDACLYFIFCVWPCATSDETHVNFQSPKLGAGVKIY